MGWRGPFLPHLQLTARHISTRGPRLVDLQRQTASHWVLSS